MLPGQLRKIFAISKNNIDIYQAFADFIYVILCWCKAIRCCYAYNHWKTMFKTARKAREIVYKFND